MAWNRRVAWPQHGDSQAKMRFRVFVCSKSFCASRNSNRKRPTLDVTMDRNRIGAVIGCKLQHYLMGRISTDLRKTSKPSRMTSKTGDARARDEVNPEARELRGYLVAPGGHARIEFGASVPGTRPKPRGSRWWRIAEKKARMKQTAPVDGDQSDSPELPVARGPSPRVSFQPRRRGAQLRAIEGDGHSAGSGRRGCDAGLATRSPDDTARAGRRSLPLRSQAAGQSRVTRLRGRLRADGRRRDPTKAIAVCPRQGRPFHQRIGEARREIRQ